MPTSRHSIHEHLKSRAQAFSWSLLFFCCALPTSAPGATAAYLYNVSGFSGQVSGSAMPLFCDVTRDELYLLGDAGQVYVSDSKGMLLAAFRIDPQYGLPVSLVAMESGRLLCLTRQNDAMRLWSFDYRGRDPKNLQLPKFDSQLAPKFSASRLLSSKNRLYAVDVPRLLVMEMTEAGETLNCWNLASLAALAPKDVDASSLSVCPNGDFLFTLPLAFQVVRVSQSGQVRSFGEKGSVPGKFNILSFAAADEVGRVYVADSLRSTVSVFDADFKFIAEFGGWGLEPEKLISPSELGILGNKLYISQNRNRGVSVFRFLD